jgi:hypothetical protein
MKKGKEMANLFDAASGLEGSQVVVLERAIMELAYQPLDHTNHRQENITSYYQNHSPKHFQDDECSTLERRNFKTHLTVQGVRSL